MKMKTNWIRWATLAGVAGMGTLALAEKTAPAVGGKPAAAAAAEDAPAAEAPAAEASKEPKASEVAEDKAEDWDRPAARELSEEVRKGLGYLAETQNEDGGWGQGGGWRMNAKGGGRVEGAADPSDIGNTCVVLNALLRAGSDCNKGDYVKVVDKGVNFLFAELEKADDETLYVTSLRSTQLQSKIGRYTDTFFSMQLLADLKGRVTAEQEKKRSDLLDMVVAKVEKHQKEDGGFKGNDGWASTLSQGVNSKALNAAWAAGGNVQRETLDRDDNNNRLGVDPSSGVVTTSPSVAGASGSTAGISLYGYSSKVRGLQEYSRQNMVRYAELKEVVADEQAKPEEKAQAAKEISKLDESEKTKDALVAQVADKVANDDSFVAGFGNNGGEEFLSYQNLSETLWVAGGKAWTDWEPKMIKTVATAQNEDGSWSGHHCITGRTFCTSTALLTLMSDRMEMPETKEVPENEPTSTEVPVADQPVAPVESVSDGQ